jgi:hypothetical protein
LSTTEGFQRKNSVVPDWHGGAKYKGISKAKDYIMERWDEDDNDGILAGNKGFAGTKGPGEALGLIAKKTSAMNLYKMNNQDPFEEDLDKYL